MRNSNARELLAAGTLPQSLEDLGGNYVEVAPHLETDVGWDDVYFTKWQAGGGYGDPLLRDPEAVVHDLAEGKITPKAAFEIYGVVGDASGSDPEATDEHRQALRKARADGTVAVNG